TKMFLSQISSGVPTWDDGSGVFILNGTSQQASSNFNISGNGTIGGNATIAGTTKLTSGTPTVTIPSNTTLTITNDAVVPAILMSLTDVGGVGTLYSSADV